MKLFKSGVNPKWLRQALTMMTPNYTEGLFIDQFPISYSNFRQICFMSLNEARWQYYIYIYIYPVITFISGGCQHMPP